MNEKPILLSDRSDSAGHWTSKEALAHCLEYVTKHPEFTQAVLMLKDPITGQMHTTIARVRCTEGMGICMRVSNGFQNQLDESED